MLFFKEKSENPNQTINCKKGNFEQRTDVNLACEVTCYFSPVYVGPFLRQKDLRHQLKRTASLDINF